MSAIGYWAGRAAGLLVSGWQAAASGWRAGYDRGVYGPPRPGRIVWPRLCPDPSAHAERETGRLKAG